MARRISFRHVLCPIDFSKASRAALVHAAAIAGRAKGRLTVLAVNDPLLASAAAAAAYDAAQLATDTEREMHRFVRQTLGEIGARTSCTLALGQPAREIGKAVTRLGADLVVMGTHGLRGASKWFFGSTTEQILRRTSVPVLAVSSLTPGKRSAGRQLPPDWPGTVLAPVDLSEHAAADVGAALQAARAFAARAVLVHVIEPVRLPPWLQAKSAADDALLASAKDRLGALARAAGRNVEWVVLIGDPAARIAECAAENRAGLVALTLRQGTGPFGPRQGVMTYRLLCASETPVLAMPRRQT